MGSYGCAELTRCERANGGYVIAWRAESALLWRLALDAVKRIPARLRVYIADDRTWWIDAAAFYRLAETFSNFADAIDADTDAWEDRRPARIPAEVAQAYAALYVALDAPAAVVQAVYRLLARVHHPDNGGDELTMKRLNAAYEVARRWAEQHAA